MKTSIKKLESFDDFVKIYSVFEGFPFFEKWTQDEIRNEFDCNLKNGYIFGYYIEDICVGFISMRKQSPNEHPIHYNHNSKVIYLSDLAVLPQYRHRGIGTTLFKYAVEVATKENFDYAYLRMNDNNSMAYDIAKKQGFKREYDYCEVITHTSSRDKRRDSEEFRIFMSKKL